MKLTIKAVVSALEGTVSEPPSAYIRHACAAIQVLIAALAFWIYYQYISHHDDVKWVNAFFADDTFYYLKIADNFFRYGALTFDGINTTNGFQPLWMVVLIALKALIGQRSIVPAALILCMVLYCVNSALLATFVRRATNNVWIGFAAQLLLLGSIGAMKANLLIMENTLAFTLVIVLFMRLQTGLLLPFEHENSKNALNGILFALLVLCRVDYGIVIAVLGLIMAFRRRTLISREILATFLPPVFALLALACVNAVYFGHPELISGYVKHHRYVADTLSRNHGSLIEHVYAPAVIVFAKTINAITFQAIVEYMGLEMRRFTFVVACALALSAVAYFAKQKIDSARPSYVPIAILLIVALLHSAMMIVYLPIFIGDAWYYSLETIAVITTAGVILSEASRRLRLPGLSFGAFILTAMMLPLISQEISFEAARWEPDPMSGRSQNFAIARYIDANTPQDAIVGSLNTGIIGYYDSRRTVNLDGLVNNFDFYDRVLSNPDRPGMLAYLRSEGIEYLTDYSVCDSCDNAEVIDRASKHFGIASNSVTPVTVLKTNIHTTIPEVDGRRLSGQLFYYLVKISKTD